MRASSSATPTGQPLAYVYFEDEPGRRVGGAPCSPGTRPGASPPTSPSCRSCCAGRTMGLIWTRPEVFA